MLIAFSKLCDIAARSLFVVIALYTLPARTTGQFGLALTLIGFFSFLCGFERHLDLQRRVVGKTAAEADRMILWAVRFYGANYAVWIPVLALLLLFWVRLSPGLTAICLVIAVGEHLSAVIYNIALILPRHRAVLAAVVSKNIVLLCIVLGLMVSRGHALDLTQLLVLWGILSALGLVAAVVTFLKTADLRDDSSVTQPPLSLADQYRASKTHFLIGAIAVAALQSDRLVVGGLLTLEQSGIYFRHIFLASFVYQIFNVASYNRLAPTVYAHVMAGRAEAARTTIRKEMSVIVPVTVAALAIVPFVDIVGLLRRIKDVSALSSVMPNYLAILVFGFLVRTIADYNALLLNSVYREHDIFVAQLVSVILALALNLTLTSMFGMAGTVATVVIGAFCYAFLSSMFVQRNPQLVMRHT